MADRTPTPDCGMPWVPTPDCRMTTPDRRNGSARRVQRTTGHDPDQTVGLEPVSALEALHRSDRQLAIASIDRSGGEPETGQTPLQASHVRRPLRLSVTGAGIEHRCWAGERRQGVQGAW